jgi:hypothetical protein
MVFFIPWRVVAELCAAQFETCSGRLGGAAAAGRTMVMSPAAPDSFSVIFRFGADDGARADRSDRRCGCCGATGSSTNSPIESALTVGALNIEHFAFGTGLGMDPVHSGLQNARHFAWRDYGSRIGHWRLFEILDELKLTATILLNSSVCHHYPEIIEKIRARGDDVLGHGRTNAEVHRSMWEDDEARANTWVCGRPDGWVRRRPNPALRPIC